MRRRGVDLEEPLIAHPQCCYFDGAQGMIGCQSEVDTPHPYWRELYILENHCVGYRALDLR
jgi:hypothetical protein